jgi:hypothetical protein
MIRRRVAAVVALAFLALGYVAARAPEELADNPAAALQAYQRARVEAIAECAKYGFATDWGQIMPDSKLAAECLSLVAQPCASFPVMPPKAKSKPGLDM